RGRGQADAAAAASGPAAPAASLAQELSAVSPAALKAWGIGGPDATASRAAADARVAAAALISDPVKAAGVLLGGPAVVEGSLDHLPLDIRTSVRGPQSVLGTRTGVLARWLQATARVRSAVASLNEALLRDDLAGSTPTHLWAAQSPVAPYVDSVAAASAHAWVGLPFPAALGPAPITSVVI